MLKALQSKNDFGALLPLLALLPITGFMSGFYSVVSESSTVISQPQAQIEHIAETNLALSDPTLIVVASKTI